MATVTCHTAATPAAVFAVLADGWSYSDWVVGTSHLRAVDGRWPNRGARLQHAFGAWPAVIPDESEVEKVIPGELLVLIVKGRPLGSARVVIDLQPAGGGTDVTMTEDPLSGPGKWVHNRVTDALLAARNTESLHRLAALAEHRTQPTSDPATAGEANAGADARIDGMATPAVHTYTLSNLAVGRQFDLAVPDGTDVLAAAHAFLQDSDVRDDERDGFYLSVFPRSEPPPSPENTPPT
jgi:hypothetical protein